MAIIYGVQIKKQPIVVVLIQLLFDSCIFMYISWFYLGYTAGKHLFVYQNV